jgi:hypothetical protein
VQAVASQDIVYAGNASLRSNLSRVIGVQFVGNLNLDQRGVVLPVSSDRQLIPLCGTWLNIGVSFVIVFML